MMLAALTLLSALGAANPHHLGVQPNAAFFHTEMPDPVPFGHVQAAAQFTYVSAPVVCRAYPFGPRNGIVNHGVFAAAGLRLGLPDDMDIAVGAAPALANVERRGGGSACPADNDVAGWFAGLSDPEFRFRWRILNTRTGGIFPASSRISLGLLAKARLGVMSATGQGLARTPIPVVRDIYKAEVFEVFGDRLGALTLGINPGYTWDNIRAAMQVGVNLRPASGLGGATMGSEVVFSAAGAVHIFIQDLTWQVDVFGRASAPIGRDALSSSNFQMPIEFIMGPRYTFYGWALQTGVGAGLSPGYGSPLFRFVMSVRRVGELPDWYGELPLFDLSFLWGPFKKRFEAPDVVDLSDRKPPKKRKKRKRKAKKKKKKRKKFKCPDNLTEDDELFFDPRCEEEREQKRRDDEELDELLRGICPVCDRTDAHHHDLIVVVSLYFDLDVDVLGPAERVRLRRELTAPPRASVLKSVHIVGHADALGNDAYNQTLSERRAQHVAGVLESMGVDAAVIHGGGRGEADPLLAGQPSDEGEAANRRVRIELSYETEFPPPAPAR